MKLIVGFFVLFACHLAVEGYVIPLESAAVLKIQKRTPDALFNDLTGSFAKRDTAEIEKLEKRDPQVYCGWCTKKRDAIPKTKIVKEIKKREAVPETKLVKEIKKREAVPETKLVKEIKKRDPQVYCGWCTKKRNAIPETKLVKEIKKREAVPETKLVKEIKKREAVPETKLVKEIKKRDPQVYCGWCTKKRNAIPKASTEQAV